MDERLSCWDDVLGTMPEATLAVRRAAFRQLLSGRAPALEEVAAEAGLAYETTREAIDLVASVGMAEIDEGTITGMDGLTTRRTRHQLVVGGVGMWTWCAYDIVGIAAALVADAVGSTQCGGCGRGIDVVIWKGRLDGGTGVVGWLPDASYSNVMVEFCPSALLFCSRSHLDQWRAREGIGSGAALDVESLAERGRSDVSVPGSGGNSVDFGGGNPRDVDGHRHPQRQDSRMRRGDGHDQHGHHIVRRQAPGARRRRRAA